MRVRSPPSAPSSGCFDSDIVADQRYLEIAAARGQLPVSLAFSFPRDVLLPHGWSDFPVLPEKRERGCGD